LLRVNDIDVSYGQVQILRKVSFDIREKEIVSLLEQRAGKTTTVSAISGFPAKGKSVHGPDITKEPYDRGDGTGQVPEAASFSQP
jgi:ABC-type branched-subunit amino acid transport system ATPase component